MSCRSGSCPSTSWTCRSWATEPSPRPRGRGPLPADRDTDRTGRQRRQVAERVAVQVDDVVAAAGAPVDERDVHAMAVPAHAYVAAAPVADAELRSGGRVQATRVRVMTGADSGLAIPRGRARGAVPGQPDGRLAQRRRGPWRRNERSRGRVASGAGPGSSLAWRSPGSSRARRSLAMTRPRPPLGPAMAAAAPRSAGSRLASKARSQQVVGRSPSLSAAGSR